MHAPRNLPSCSIQNYAAAGGGAGRERLPERADIAWAAQPCLSACRVEKSWHERVEDFRLDQLGKPRRRLGRAALDQNDAPRVELAGKPDGETVGCHVPGFGNGRI